MTDEALAFSHDPARPLDLIEIGAEPRDGAMIRDVTFDAGSEDRVEAFVVEPATGSARGPGVLYLHWFDTQAPDGNRTQFLDEAALLAQRGVTSLLPQGVFPWSVDPAAADADIGRIRAEVIRQRRTLDLLTDWAGVEADRIGLVGHDFGAMYGTLVLAVDRRPSAAVLIAATPRWGDWFLPFWQISGERGDYLRALGPYDPITHVGAAPPARLLFQFGVDDYYVAGMTAMELQRAAGDGIEARTYPTDHAMRSTEARADRVAFLVEQLGLG